MSTSIKILIVLAILLVLGYLLLAGQSEMPKSESQDERTSDFSVQPISHASFVATIGGLTVLNDPVGEAADYAAYSTPDLLLLSDIHDDHLSVAVLEELVGEGTVVIAPASVYEELPSAIAEKTVIMGNGDRHEVLGVGIEAVPMYNVPESEDAYHVKGRGNGYILSTTDARVYIAGDTGPIPEMLALTNIDYAFIPMNLPFTMDIETAAAAVLTFKPKTVYPYHYRGAEGLSNVAAFKATVEEQDPNVKVVLLDWYPTDAETGE